jgi:hypothetical protein
VRPNSSNSDRISPTTCGASALTEYARFFVGKKTGGGPAVRGGSATGRCVALVGAATTGAVGSTTIVASASLRRVPHLWRREENLSPLVLPAKLQSAIERDQMLRRRRSPVTRNV